MKAVAQSLLIKALESATNAILISDHAGTIVWVNQAAWTWVAMRTTR